MYWQEIYTVAKQIDNSENNTHIMLEFVETITELKSELDAVTQKIQMMCRI